MRDKAALLFVGLVFGAVVWGLRLTPFGTKFGTEILSFQPHSPAIALTFEGTPDSRALSHLIRLLASRRVLATFFVPPQASAETLLPLIQGQHEIGFWLVTRPDQLLGSSSYLDLIQTGQRRLVEMGYTGGVPIRSWGPDPGLTLALFGLGNPSIGSSPWEEVGSIFSLSLEEPSLPAQVTDFLDRQEQRGVAVVSVSGLRKLHQDL